MRLTESQIRTFQDTVWAFYAANARPMPWREDHTPYAVLVSEFMLQQTQVVRVIPKYQAFMRRFPDVSALADAPLADVVSAWNGLGYNRRAKFLHAAARMIRRDFGGRLPADAASLVRLPGIGPNTAGAILAYAFNKPAVFLETNIKTVLLHHFFGDRPSVSDAELRAVADRVLDDEHPREWYWALMDYGTHLKKTHGSQLARSAAYRRQSPLKGSLRELRGHIVTRLVEGAMTPAELRARWQGDERLEPALASLQRDGLIVVDAAGIRLTAGE